jgi:hypothetical protein
MATKKITDLVELISAASGDVLPIVDISDDITKKIQVSNFPISTATQSAIDAKQDTLVSGTNIKTINSSSLLGSGDVAVQETLVSGTNIKTLNSESLLGSGNIEITASPAGVAGAIQFSNGSAFASDASNLFWDDTNNWLGIGTNVPTFNIESKSVGNQLKASNPNDIYTYLEVNANGGQVNMKFGNGSGTTHFINNYSTGMWASNKFAFGPSFFTPSGQVHVKGSGSTSSTTSLLVQNSSGTELFKVTDDGSATANTFKTTSLTIQAGQILSSSGMRLRNTSAASGGTAVSTADAAPANTMLYVKGFGTTSATTALLVQNSSGTQNFKVADNGSVQIGTFNFVSSSVIENTTTRLVATTGGVAVNSNYAFANSSSILDVASTTKGFLPPRMTTTQKNAISSPASGLMVYDSTTNKLCCYNGSTWNDLF